MSELIGKTVIDEDHGAGTIVDETANNVTIALSSYEGGLRFLVVPKNDLQPFDATDLDERLERREWRECRWCEGKGHDLPDVSWCSACDGEGGKYD